MALPGGPRPSYCGVGNTNFDALGFSLKHAYYDGRLFPALIQRFGAALAVSALPHGAQSHRVGTWLRVLERFGAASVSGAVFSGQVGAVADAVVIKMNRDKRASAALAKEFEAQQELNALRVLCPHFVLGLAAFMCAALNTDPGGIPATGEPMCSGAGDVVEFIVMERVDTIPARPHDVPPTTRAQSYTWENYLLATPTTQMVVSVLLQVLCALKIAQATHEFTHYDLHCNNVMMQGIEQVEDYGRPATHAVIRYDYPDAAGDPLPEAVRTQLIAVIIDFGWTRLRKRDGTILFCGEHQTKVDPASMRENGISNQFSAAYDTFTFVTFTFFALKAAKPRAPWFQKYLDFCQEFWTRNKTPSIRDNSNALFWTRPGFEADGRPGCQAWLDADFAIRMLQKHFPGEYDEAVNPAHRTAADAVLPATLGALAEHLDCAAPNFHAFPDKTVYFDKP